MSPKTHTQRGRFRNYKRDLSVKGKKPSLFSPFTTGVWVQIANQKGIGTLHLPVFLALQLQPQSICQSTKYLIIYLLSMISFCDFRYCLLWYQNSADQMFLRGGICFYGANRQQMVIFLCLLFLLILKCNNLLLILRLLAL